MHFKHGLISGVLPETLWEAMGILGAPAAVLPISLQGRKLSVLGPGMRGWLVPLCLAGLHRLPMKRSPGHSSWGRDPHSGPDLLVTLSGLSHSHSAGCNPGHGDSPLLEFPGVSN